MYAVVAVDATETDYENGNDDDNVDTDDSDVDDDVQWLFWSSKMVIELSASVEFQLVIGIELHCRFCDLCLI